jgi:hypothetical protein
MQTEEEIVARFLAIKPKPRPKPPTAKEIAAERWKADAEALLQRFLANADAVQQRLEYEQEQAEKHNREAYAISLNAAAEARLWAQQALDAYPADGCHVGPGDSDCAFHHYPR